MHAHVCVCVCVSVKPIYRCVQDSEKYVEQLLTLFNRFSKLVKEAFQDDPRFLTARDKVRATRISTVTQPSDKGLLWGQCSSYLSGGRFWFRVRKCINLP